VTVVRTGSMTSGLSGAEVRICLVRLAAYYSLRGPDGPRRGVEESETKGARTIWMNGRISLSPWATYRLSRSEEAVRWSFLSWMCSTSATGKKPVTSSTQSLTAINDSNELALRAMVPAITYTYVIVVEVHVFFYGNA
jgi:hypothetical protein